MSYLRWIERMNTWKREEFLPFLVAGQPVGWVLKTWLDRFRSHPDCFEVEPNQVRLHSRLDTFQVRTDAVEGVAKDWHNQGLLNRWVGEQYPVASWYGEKPLMLIERAAIPCFGVKEYGIHLNGMVHKEGKLWMWIAKRSEDRVMYPGHLDNLVGGGMHHPLSAKETMVKECAEEANIAPSLAENARAVGAVCYNRQLNNGVQRDYLFNYDLELPEDFTPSNTDGEVEAFYLWPFEEVLQRVLETDQFKTNCNLVILDFAIRHGFLTPESPDYLAILHGVLPEMENQKL